MIRPLLRFRLRTLLLVMLLACVILGTTVQRALTQKRTVERIREIGGSITYGYQRIAQENVDKYYQAAKNNRATVLALRRAFTHPPGPEWLQQLIGDEYFQSVVAVGFRAPQHEQRILSAEGLAMLQRLPMLDSLRIDGMTFCAIQSFMKR